MVQHYQPMTLPAKRLLYVLAFLAFAALSPLVVLYSWGYRYDFANQKVEVTGILYLKSYPGRASVSLNGRAVPDQTPAQLTGLQPGPYDIAVSREGMQSWRKTLLVKPQLATFAEDIVLFRSRPVSQLVEQLPTVVQMSSSPDGRLLATIARAGAAPALEMIVRDVATHQVVSRQTIAPTLAPYSIAWSDSGRRLAVVGAKQALAIVVGNSLYPIVITPPPAATWLGLQWDATNDNQLYAPSTRGLFRFDLATKRWETISHDAILGLLQRGSGSMAVMATSGTAWLRPWPSSGLWQLPLSSSTATLYTGASGSESLVTWETGSGAWLVDVSSSSPAVAAAWPDVQQLTWDPHAAVLAVLQPAGVTLLHLADNVTSTIPLPDLSGRSTKIFWYPGGTHLYLARPGILEVAEVDPRGERNRHTLLDDDAFTGMAAASYDSASVYWIRSSSTSATTNGFYRAAVQ